MKHTRWRTISIRNDAYSKFIEKRLLSVVGSRRSVLICLCLLVSCLVFYQYQVHNIFKDSKSTQYSLSVIDTHVGSWEYINSPWRYWPGIGFCRNSTSLLTQFDDDVCFRRECLYSEKWHMNVHLDKLLTFDPNNHDEKYFRWEGWNGKCRLPRGGQIPPTNGEGIEVTFLYTLHNNAPLAAAAILEVFRTAHESRSAEFVVIDDGSSEDMTPVTQLLHNLHLIFGVTAITKRHKEPQGYLRSNNEGLRDNVAHGTFAVLLNSDVLVLPGWLTMLLHTMRRFPGGKVGMVGPMMIDESNIISEAGGGVFRYGKPYNSGRGVHPLDQSQQQARVADYISAACLLVRRKLFVSLGLFNQKYAPAYYEDTDAALVHEQHGWRTILQPLSVVRHFEGSTYSSVQKKALMAENAHKFKVAHGNLLDYYCPAPNRSTSVKHSSPRTLDVHMGATFYRQRNRILVLKGVLSDLDTDTESVRVHAILGILGELGYSITFEAAGGNLQPLLRLWLEGVNAVAPGTLHDMAQATKSPFHNRLRGFGIDFCPWKAILIAGPDIYAQQITDLKALCPYSPIIFDAFDLHFARVQRKLNVSLQHLDRHDTIDYADYRHMRRVSGQVELFRQQANENRALEHIRLSNITLVASQNDEHIIHEKMGVFRPDIRVVSNIYRTTEEEAADEHIIQSGAGEVTATALKEINDRKMQDEDPLPRSGALFVGNMCHTPDIDAAHFIIQEVLRNRTLFPPDFRVHFVWTRSHLCSDNLLDRAARHSLIVVHRDISRKALKTLYAQVKVVLAPYRYGGRMRGEVIYGLLHGIPMIATPLAIEGMPLVNEESYLRAETGADFSSAILRLSSDPRLFRTLSRGGKAVMQAQFGREQAKTRIQQALRDLQVSAEPGPFVCPHLSEFDAHPELFGASYWQTTTGTLDKGLLSFIPSLFSLSKAKIYPVYPRLSFPKEQMRYTHGK